MTVDNESQAPSAAPKPAPEDLATALQTVATAAKAADADDEPESDEIAADDVGASGLAIEINRLPKRKQPLGKP